MTPVTSLAATTEGPFGLAQGRVWFLSSRPRAIDLPAHRGESTYGSSLRRRRLIQNEVRRIANVGCLPAADCGERFVVFDSGGNVRTEYPQAPFGSSLLEWPGVAIETRPEQGLLVMHDVYETNVDAEQLPDEILTLVPRQGQKMAPR